MASAPAHRPTRWTLVAAAIALVLSTGACSRAALVRIYVGTYTDLGSRGIYRVDFDPSSGRFVSDPAVAVQTENPSFLAVGPNGRYVLAVNELWRFNGEKSGAVSAFQVDASSGDLRLMNQQPSGGINPCFIDIDATGRHALVANYTSGTVAVLPIEEDGRLRPASMVRGGTGTGPVKDRQDGPHAHHLVFAASQQFVLWTNLGSDWVAVDRYDAASGQLQPASPAGVSVQPGSGPRHLAWHPSGRVVYLLNELSATVTLLRFDAAAGALTVGPSIGARAAGATGANTAAEIAVSSDGRFAYASNRGDDTIAVFGIDRETLELSRLTHVSSGGRTPRHFAIDPSGRWLVVANQESHALVVFRIDAATGIPAPTGAIVTIPSPVNLAFMR